MQTADELNAEVDWGAEVPPLVQVSALADTPNSESVSAWGLELDMVLVTICNNNDPSP